MRVFVLEYHDLIVGGDADASGFPGPAAASYKVDVETFATHLRALQHRPAVGLDARTVLDTSPAARNAGASAIPVMFTFDDGGVSAVEIARRLDGCGWRGHFFVPTAHLGRSGFLNATQARALHESGHVVGSHSHTHPVRMARCSDAQMADEWRESVARLEDAVGAPVPVASVPGGYYSRRVAEFAARAGVRVLFTSEPVSTVSHVDGCSVVGRFTVRRGMPAASIAALVGEPGRARAGQWLTWNTKKLLKAAGGGAYLRARDVMFGRS